MPLLPKNPNESNYIGGKKHIIDVIKNSGPGETLIWLNPEEDFNNNSTLIVAESEEALFFNNGIIESVFDRGKYVLNTGNQPFLGRLRRTISGGISTYNCKVYFVNKTHTAEIYWGTDNPIEVVDPHQGIPAKLKSHGSYRIQIIDSKKFLIKLVGNNVQSMSQNEINNYFRSQFLQKIKSHLASEVKRSQLRLIGISSEAERFACAVQDSLSPAFEDYGIRLVNFSISNLSTDLLSDERTRIRDEALGKQDEQNIHGIDYRTRKTAEILGDVANNPGSGGMANVGAGLGMMAGTVGVFSHMAKNFVEPLTKEQEQYSKQKYQETLNSGMFQQDNTDYAICEQCGKENPSGSKFCNQCGQILAVKDVYCNNCGEKLPANAKFCNECGTKRG